MTARARRMLDALEDGCRTREQLYAHAGGFYLTNNAAAELRAAGIDVMYERVDGQDAYRLLDESGAHPPDARLVEQDGGQFCLGAFA